MSSLRRSFTLKRRTVFGLLAAALLALAAASVCIGAVPVRPAQALAALLGTDTASLSARVVLYARLPRVCASLVTGAALAVSGVIIQSVLANPLAAPHIIGVNSGAGLAAAICCALLPSAVGAVPIASFLGAVCGALLVLAFAERTGASRITLVLAGVAISGLFSAGIDTVVTLVPDALTGYTDFRVGGLNGVTMARVLPAAALIGASMILAFTMAGQLDVLALGTETAQSLGLSVRPVRLILLILAAAMAGASVSVCGLVGFVGLIVPHAMRRLVGEESLPLMVASALGGAVLMTGCDLLARTIAAPYEIPVGIVLDYVGAPFFLWLLVRQRGGRTHD